MTDPSRTSGGPRERPAPVYGPPESYRRRALLAAAVALLGGGAFVVGVRRAVRLIPPDAEARAAARRDSALRERPAGAPGAPNPAARPTRGGVQPDEMPRIR